MPNEMGIRLSDGPAGQLVRIHTEQNSWDEPDVRYLRRKLSLRDGPSPLCLQNPGGSEEFVVTFGGVSVKILAGEDHIQIALSEGPVPAPSRLDAVASVR